MRARRRAGCLLIAAAVLLPSCLPREEASPREAPPFRVVGFTHAGLADVPLNAPLIFTFSRPVDPATVNGDTIRIETVLDGRRIRAGGVFVAHGRRVTWYPRISSLAVPSPGSEALLPLDAGLNTTATSGLRYEVVIPALPEVNTVRTPEGEPLRKPFVSHFYTAPGLAGAAALYSTRHGAYRAPLRVADVLAYAAPANGDRPPLAPAVLENPLFLNPTLLALARSEWPRQHVSGEWVDMVFGLRLLPPLPAAAVPREALPPGLRTPPDERLLSNRLGRPLPVQALSIPFTQPLDPALFLDSTNQARPWPALPFTVRLLTRPDEDPAHAMPEPYSLVLRNGPEPEAARVLLVFHRPLRRGWLRLDVDARRVRAITGKPLEGNWREGFTYVWPVRLNAP